MISLDHLQEHPHPLEVQASGLPLDLAGVVDVVDVILLNINLAQDPQDFAELQVQAGRSDLPAQIQAFDGLGVDVPLEVACFLFEFLPELCGLDGHAVGSNGRFDQSLKFLLKGSPPDDAVEDIGGDVPAVFLLELDGLILALLVLNNCNHLLLLFLCWLFRDF